MFHDKDRIQPPPLDEGSTDVASLIDTYYNAYNAARLREACQIITHMMGEDTLVGVSLSGALTPAGLSSVIVPLMRAGFIDYIASTGANLYHDLQFDQGLSVYRGSGEIASGAHDVRLRQEGVIRIHDLVFPAKDLYQTDEWLYRVLLQPEFRGRTLGTSELHNHVGRYALETARRARVRPSILATAHEYDVPVYCPSPGDSTIGMNVAALWAANGERAPRVDPSIDVTEMAALVYEAKRSGRRSATIMFGGGAPKNFLLQTEPQIQEILGLEETGHDYFVQFTDARPDTGGLSGATPQEAASWGKVDPDRLPNCIVCYADSTIVMPLVASYLLARAKPRGPKRLYTRRGEMIDLLRREYRRSHNFQKFFGEPAE